MKIPCKHDWIKIPKINEELEKVAIQYPVTAPVWYYINNGAYFKHATIIGRPIQSGGQILIPLTNHDGEQFLKEYSELSMTALGKIK